MPTISKAILTNIISKQFGRFASKKFPRPIQKVINNTYKDMMGVNLDEFQDITHYRTLNELFTRKLKKNRDFPKDENIFISPCDSLITEASQLDKEKLLQIKGYEYSADELLSEFIEPSIKERVYDGLYINFYLSPKDYHRFHVPFDMKIVKAVQIPGFLYPVNFKYLNKVQNLFIKNERVVLECYDKNQNLFFMVLVGALNVGKIVLNFDSRIDTNANIKVTRTYFYGDKNLKKGEELGMFKMGSTIVMLFEKDYVRLLCESGQRVRFTDQIASVKH
jgi:phosphatidylserine decarboxylase